MLIARHERQSRRLSHIFGREKFMTLFSILFGAGIILFTNNANNKGYNAGKLHYRRNFWLLLFGLAHAYMIWHGDILVAYSLCAFLVYVFRKKSIKTLFILAFVFIAVHSLMYFFFQWSIPFWDEAATQQNINRWSPGESVIVKEIESYTGSWIQQMDHRVPFTIMMQTIAFFFFVFWRVTGLMLLGMAFYKLGIITAEKSKKFYLNGAIVGMLLGMLIILWGLIYNFNHEWSWIWLLH